MRVNINTTEQTTGLLRKKTYYNIGCKVEFTEEEKAVIEKSKLEDRIFMDGQPIKGLEHLPVHVYIKTLLDQEAGVEDRSTCVAVMRAQCVLRLRGSWMVDTSSGTDNSIWPAVVCG